MIFTISTSISKDEEVHKMSAENTHALRLGGGRSISSPVSNNLCSLDINTEYVLLVFTIFLSESYKSLPPFLLLETLHNR